MATYHVIGLMSGSSLDGVDLAYCTFEEQDGLWTYKIVQTEFTPYPQKWVVRLKNLPLQNALTYFKTHTFYGHYLGELIKKFIDKYALNGKVDFIASHGQTIFHQPENLITSQIGDGAAMAVKCGVPVICNFRTCDVALGGQGAPIVPIGDIHLFAKHRFCLNLGGIANISCKVSSDRIVAYDICGNNLILNKLANELDAKYDDGGRWAASGQVHEELLADLNKAWYFGKPYPKSLSAGWVDKVIMPMIGHHQLSIEDCLRTAVEHIAIQIARDLHLIYEQEGIKNIGTDSMLITGGGARNDFLIARIKAHAPVQVVLPDVETIDFKEALIMAFVGVLRIRGEVNCLSSVTGASMDNVGGEVYSPFGGGL